MTTTCPIYIGYSDTERLAYAVAVESLLEHAPDQRHDIIPVSRTTLAAQGLYTRPTSRLPSGQLFDELSEAPMSTDHAIARFFVPYLRSFTGWALFMDGDILVRDDIGTLVDLADPAYAVQVVKHAPQQFRAVKKGGVIQQPYPCKNWSSVMLWHCGHPANQALTLDVLNTWPGRDLHAFRWLDPSLIGALPLRWNWLVGEADDPAIVHYTLGTPDLPGHAQDPYADEWRRYAQQSVGVAGR